VLAVALSILLLAQSPPSPEATGAVEVVELSDGDGVPGLRATFVVDAAADVVLDLLWDVTRFRTIFPDIEALTVLARPDDDTVDVRFFVDAVVATPTYTLRRSIDRGGRRVSWVNIGGDLKKIVGSWSVSPAGPARSRVVYESFVDVGVAGVSGMYRSLVLGRVDQMVARVQAAARTAPPRPVPSTAPGALLAPAERLLPAPGSPPPAEAPPARPR
jgi:ribosome-associated toxin RatA of RatAB toxin-antitoxin module